MRNSVRCAGTGASRNNVKRGDPGSHLLRQRPSLDLQKFPHMVIYPAKQVHLAEKSCTLNFRRLWSGAQCPHRVLRVQSLLGCSKSWNSLERTLYIFPPSHSIMQVLVGRTWCALSRRRSYRPESKGGWYGNACTFDQKHAG